ncbi:FkbM family methyltransferase [Granulosicoccus sp. 3-233]|uniref:FkbM family methyltransferase n=1 Tax=Granulosicoccus sp. 3-233 TaxID=3417969 RepID=UPI003D33EDB6
MSRRFEYDESSIIADILNNMPVRQVVDIGANRGKFARKVIKHSKNKIGVLCVEPNKDAIGGFAAKQVSNNMVKILNCAVDASESNQKFYITNNDEFSSLKRPEDIDPMLAEKILVNAVVDVNTLTLDSILKSHMFCSSGLNVFVKIDSQGMDYEIVEACTQLEERVCCILTEISMSDLYSTKVDWKEHVQMLEERGFVMAAVYQSNPGHLLKIHDINAVFINSRIKSCE